MEYPYAANRTAIFMSLQLPKVKRLSLLRDARERNLQPKSLIALLAELDKFYINQVRGVFPSWFLKIFVSSSESGGYKLIEALFTEDHSFDEICVVDFNDFLEALIPQFD
jgi:hypothetical protein